MEKTALFTSNIVKGGDFSKVLGQSVVIAKGGSSRVDQIFRKEIQLEFGITNNVA